MAVSDGLSLEVDVSLEVSVEVGDSLGVGDVEAEEDPLSVAVPDGLSDGDPLDVVEVCVSEGGAVDVELDEDVVLPPSLSFFPGVDVEEGLCAELLDDEFPDAGALVGPLLEVEDCCCGGA